MAGTVEHLPAVIPSREPDRPGPGSGDHPMRVVTEEVAAGRGWDEDRARQVAGFFDQLAPEWHTRDAEGRLDPLVDALERADVDRDGTCIEVGSGTGLVTPTLAARFGGVVAVDLSEEMLRLAPTRPPRLRADQARLPIPDGAAAVVAHVNAFLFPAEVDRVLAPGGAVIWVCTRGEQTPIYLSAEAVVDALPGEWRAVASRAGAGTWVVARRVL